MTPKQQFDLAMSRADHLLRLYGLLHDTRKYAVRRDWASKFKDLMHWPKNEVVIRVDGARGESLLILRAAAGLSRSEFTHDYLAELLRATVVAATSALDRYMHDLVVYHSWSLICRGEERIPRELKKLQIPLLAARVAVDRVRRQPQSRPGVLLKEALREHLHREFTFQRPDDVLKAASMLGVKDFWTAVADKMPGQPRKDAVIQTLREITTRRNQIAHEADVVRKAKSKSITLRDISVATATVWVAWVRDLVAAIDSVVASAV